MELMLGQGTDVPQVRTGDEIARAAMGVRSQVVAEALMRAEVFQDLRDLGPRS